MKFTGCFPSSLIKRHCDITLGKMLQPTALRADDCLHPYLRAANIEWGRIDLCDLKQMYFSKSDLSKYSVSTGDLVGLEGGDVGRASIVPQEVDGTGFQNSVHRVRARKGNHIPFALFWMQHLKSSGYFDLVCSKATLAHFTSEKFAVTPFPLIDLPTQKRIAAFLDYETARIDDLIAKKERLVEVLGEKRAALITAAVTGQISANNHGEAAERGGGMMRLRHMLKLSPSAQEIRGAEPTNEVTFAPMDAIRDGAGGLDLSITKPLSEVQSGSYNYFTNGDVLLAKVTPCFENGKKALAANLNGQIGYATSEVHVLRPDPGKLWAPFLMYLLASENFRAEGMRSMTGAGGLRRVAESAILNCRLAITDLPTQKRIAAFLDYETAQIDKLIAKMKQLVEALKEKRAALITAAVTGQIDVNSYSKAGTTSQTLDRIREEVMA